MAGAYIENNIFAGTWNGLNGVTDEVFTNNLAPPTPPQFVDPAASDYQLNANSAAVGGGAVNQSFTAGYDPETSDIGAFSYGVQPWSAGISHCEPLRRLDSRRAQRPGRRLAECLANYARLAEQRHVRHECRGPAVHRRPDIPAHRHLARRSRFLYRHAAGPRHLLLPRVRGQRLLCLGLFQQRHRRQRALGGRRHQHHPGRELHSRQLQRRDRQRRSAHQLRGRQLGGVRQRGLSRRRQRHRHGHGHQPAHGRLRRRGASGDNEVQFRLDSPTAAPFATVSLQYDPTGFVTTTVTFYPNVIPAGSPILAGYHNVYITFGGTSGVNAANIAWFQIASMESSALLPPVPVDYSDTGPDAQTGDGVKPVGGGAIGNCDGGKWVQYANMNFTSGINQFTLDYSPYSNGPNDIMVRLDSPTATPFATFTTPAITTWPAITVASVAVSGIAPGLHDFYITFTGGSGVCNIYSFAFSDSTPGAAPTNASAAPAPGMAMNITWTDNSSNEAGYKIERSTDDETFVQVGQVGDNVTSFQDTGVSPATTYYYRISPQPDRWQHGLYERGRRRGPDLRSVLERRRRCLERRRWRLEYRCQRRQLRHLVRWLRRRVRRVRRGSCYFRGRQPAGDRLRDRRLLAQRRFRFPALRRWRRTSGRRGGDHRLADRGGQPHQKRHRPAHPRRRKRLRRPDRRVGRDIDGQRLIEFKRRGSRPERGPLDRQRDGRRVSLASGVALAPGTNGAGSLSCASLQLGAGCTLDYTLGTGISGQDGLVTVNGQLGLAAGVIVNVTPGADRIGMYPLFDLPSYNFFYPVTIAAGWTIQGTDLGGHAYSRVATGNDLDLDVQAVAGTWSASGGGTFSWERRR